MARNRRVQLTTALLEEQSVCARYTLSACVATKVLAGCGESQPPIGAPGAMPQSVAITTRPTAAYRNAIPVRCK